MSKAIYPGSFDPITVGHIDMIERAAPLFRELVVLVAKSHKKTYLFSDAERETMVKESLGHIENVTVELFSGLTVDFAKKNKANVIVRGLRNVIDFEYEKAIAHMNSKLNSKIETMIMLASPETACISSHMVKEIASYQGPLEGLVPSNVASALSEKF